MNVSINNTRNPEKALKFEELKRKQAFIDEDGDLCIKVSDDAAIIFDEGFDEIGFVEEVATVCCFSRCILVDLDIQVTIR
jgi:hypothetical protein